MTPSPSSRIATEFARAPAGTTVPSADATRGLDVEQLHRLGGVGDVEHLDEGLGRVDDQQPLPGGVVLDVLGGRLVEDLGLLGTERLQLEGRARGRGPSGVGNDDGARGHRTAGHGQRHPEQSRDCSAGGQGTESGRGPVDEVRRT
jgi:hypothetical protein